MPDSPFSKYRNILVSENYSAAKALQDFALSCYNGHLAQFRGDALRNFDANHMAIFFELARHYHAYGEEDSRKARKEIEALFKPLENTDASMMKDLDILDV